MKYAEYLVNLNLDSDRSNIFCYVFQLPVCDSNNQVVGILTIGDLAHYDQQIGKQQVCTTLENICNCEGEIKNGK